MASLAEVKKYFESGEHGRPLPLSEVKVLSAEVRQELCDELDKLSEAEKLR